MRFVYFFVMMFVLAACNTNPVNQQDDAPAGSNPAPKTRQPEQQQFSAKQNKLANHLRRNPHLSVQPFGNDDTIFVQMRSGDSFQSDSVSPTQILTEVLDYVVNALLDNGGKYEIKVVGHTDNVGSQQANMRTSEKRALVVALYLIDKGLDSRRVRYEGKGSLEPIVDSSSQEGRDVNRRVDLLIRPIKIESKKMCLFPDCIND
jgi:outer membrane protein OmpA-like peptidoglycan-associated protein